jgi:hypothetical protein
MESKYIHYHEHRCEHCKRIFTAKRTDAKYCRNSCRQQAYNLREATAVVKYRIREFERSYSAIIARGYLRRGELENYLSDLRLYMNTWGFRKLPEGHELGKYYLEILVLKYEKLFDSYTQNLKLLQNK